MSIPIRACLAYKAANGDEAAYQRLLSAIRINLKHGAFSQYPCECEPKHTATEEQLEALAERLDKELRVA